MCAIREGANQTECTNGGIQLLDQACVLLVAQLVFPLITDVLGCRKEGPPPQRRDRLPKPQQAEKSVSLWSILKEVVGKDLTRVCLPVYFNEPLSALQKLAEELEYSEVIDQVRHDA